MKTLREETSIISHNLPKLLYFTVVLDIWQCANATHITPTEDMKSVPRYLIFYLKIIQNCLENQYQKPLKCVLLPGSLFASILTPKNRSKVMSKSSQIVLSTSKLHHAAPEVSKKALDALKAAPRWLQHRPSMGSRSLKSVKIIGKSKLVHSFQ